MKEALDIVGINFLDNIIIGRNTFYSSGRQKEL
jgi:DNA repair protein RadC